MKYLLLALVVVLMFGCYSTPEALMLSKPLKVEQERLQEYWIQKNERFSFKTPSNISPSTIKPGEVTIEYLIDSNGNIFDAKIVESSPPGLWDKTALKALKNLEYEPAKSNNTRTPVYIKTIFNFG
jgi:TonB family protein